MSTEQYIDDLFIKAGWYEGREFETTTQPLYTSNAAHKNAVDVLTKYGGLEVGEVGAGREMSASEIAFRTETLDFGGEFHNYWKTLDTSLFAFASAHRDHTLLVVDSNNEFYIFTEPDEQLYKIGSFEETIRRVLLGISYGIALEKSA